MVIAEAPRRRHTGRGAESGCCTTASPTDRLCIPTATRRRGRILLNQQLWLWGQDIRRPEGNALIEYGFARMKPPEGQRGSNTYLLHQPEGTSILLWACGLFYHRGGCGGVFIPHFGFAPRLARFADLPITAWSSPQLGACRPPHGVRQWASAQRLLIPALRWVADYERWVLTTRGLAYRHSCVVAWPKTSVAAEALVASWEGLAAECDTAMRAFIAVRMERLRDTGPQA